MLQICSGKLFERDAEHRNRLRGILYTNLRIYREQSIETAVGRILSLEVAGQPNAFAFEFTELIEARPDGPSVLVSRTAGPYISEFSVIASFGLNATCSPDVRLVDRLTSGQRGIRVSDPPTAFVPRVFDRDVWLKDEEVAPFTTFVQDLLSLERRSYLAAVRAMSTYVAGLHRMADDLELAYTLLVASLESLAQGFDGHQGQWSDYDQAKRERIDRALASATAEVAEAVRSALLQIEHLSLKRRFRDFTLDHTTPSFFREEAATVPGAVGRRDLGSALTQAYQLRSSYIHNLVELPRPMTMGAMSGDTVRIDRTAYLSFRGLVRIARHVILEFVRRQPKIEKEVYNYHLEQPGIVSLPMAAQYWVWQTDGLRKEHGRQRLTGMLEQLAEHLRGDPNAVVTDIREVLAKAEPWFPQLSVAERRPFVALHMIFNGFAAPIDRMASHNTVTKKYENDFSSPSSEALILNLLFDVTPNWSLAKHEEAIEHYFFKRTHKDGYRFPELFEAALSLSLAERYRAAEQAADARRLVTQAVENHPSMPALKTLEQELPVDVAIDWRAMLLPPQRDDDPQSMP